MALEWIGWVSSSAVGIGGLWVANRSGERQRASAREVVTLQTEAQERMAREQRQHESKTRAYEDCWSTSARPTSGPARWSPV